MKKYGLLLLIIIFASVNLNAQFRIKIPKIKKPKINKPQEVGANNPANNSNVSSDSADLLTKSRERVMDDAFTFFEAEPVKEHDPSIRGYKDVGWNMKINLRLLGTFPDRSGFSLILSKKGERMGKIRCEGKPYRKANDYSLQTPLLRQGKDLNYDNYLQVLKCFKKKTVIKGTGEYDVDVYFFNGDTDEETLVRKYKIDVHRSPRVRGSAVKPQPDVADYYISRHGEVPASYLFLAPKGLTTYFLGYSRNTSAQNNVWVYFNYSPKKAPSSFPLSYARCSVNGQRLKLPGPSPYADQVVLKRTQWDVGVYTDRLAEQYKRGSEYRDYVVFDRVSAALPLSFGDSNSNRLKIDDHPGDWQCDIMHDGEKIRTFRWKVGDDGNIVPHPEQASGNVNLFYNGYLVETEIPEGGTEYDYRLMPTPNEGIFYGIPWTTPEGKALAASVPTKGKPFQVPSNKAN